MSYYDESEVLPDNYIHENVNKWEIKLKYLFCFYLKMFNYVAENMLLQYIMVYEKFMKRI